jgi:hypothetical protein
MGMGQRGNQIHAIDFGLAKEYRDPETQSQIRYREHMSLLALDDMLASTPTWELVGDVHVSIPDIAADSEPEQSRRDDLESWVLNSSEAK